VLESPVHPRSEALYRVKISAGTACREAIVWPYHSCTATPLGSLSPQQASRGSERHWVRGRPIRFTGTQVGSSRRLVGTTIFFFLPFTKRTFRSTFTHGNFTGEFFFSSAGTSWPRRRRFPYQTTTNLLGKTLSPEGTSMIVLNRKKFSNDVGT